MGGGSIFRYCTPYRDEIKMKTTLYDKNGNMIIGVESASPEKSCEAVDKGLVASAAFFGAIVLSLVGFKIDDMRQAKKDKQHAEEIERLKKEAIAKKDEIMNSKEFKEMRDKLSGFVQFTYKYIQTANAKFKQLVNASQDEYVKKYKSHIISGLQTWTVDKIRTEFANVIVDFYMNKTLSGCTALQTYDFSDVADASEDEWDSVFPEIDEIYDKAFMEAMNTSNEYHYYMDLDNYEWDDEQLFVYILEYLGLKDQKEYLANSKRYNRVLWGK